MSMLWLHHSYALIAIQAVGGYVQKRIVFCCHVLLIAGAVKGRPKRCGWLDAVVCGAFKL
jgi:hypothetical protein